MTTDVSSITHVPNWDPRPGRSIGERVDPGMHRVGPRDDGGFPSFVHELGARAAASPVHPRNAVRGAIDAFDLLEAESVSAAVMRDGSVAEDAVANLAQDPQSSG